MMKPSLRVVVPSAALAACASLATDQASSSQSAPAQPPPFQWPERIQNAKVLPADIGADRLRDTMRTFAISLGVRCTHCHAGEEGAPLGAIDFASDANPSKETARGMIRMVRHLNRENLPAILGPADAPRVTCYTCHRGSAEPAVAPPPEPPTSSSAHPPD